MVIRQWIAICRRQLQIALKLGNINGHLSHILELCECDRLRIVALGEPAESSLLLSLPLRRLGGQISRSDELSTLPPYSALRPNPVAACCDKWPMPDAMPVSSLGVCTDWDSLEHKYFSPA